MRLFFSTGEASGDAYAAALASRLVGNDVRMEGIIGARGMAAGIETVADNRNWGAIGAFESLRKSPLIARGYYQGLAALRQGPPGICIAVDFGYMNIRLVRRAKAMGWKTLYFSPPGSWRKNKQGSDLPKISDEIVTPFSWSADILAKMGASVHWYGHPLRQMIADAGVPEGVRDGIAILPGSRLHELENNIPAIAEALKNYDGVLRLSQAPNVSREDLIALWKKHSSISAEPETDLYRLLKQSRAAIVCSGTATLESALCGCPTVVVYRGSKMMELEFKIRRPKFDYISLPNILMERRVVPELIQWDATPDRIWHEVSALEEDGVPRQQQLDAFTEIETILGPSNALDETVKLIRSMSQSQ
ncbi:MAG: lipid-A-disaccharide synthase [Fimbriimonadaceae bacterium]